MFELAILDITFFLLLCLAVAIGVVLLLRWLRNDTEKTTKRGLRVVVAWAVLAATPAAAAPSDDIRAYCAYVHRSYQIRLVCERQEQAGKARLYRQQDMPYGIPRDIWDYCGSIHDSWQIMEVCTRQELRAKRLLSR